MKRHDEMEQSREESSSGANEMMRRDAREGMWRGEERRGSGAEGEEGSGVKRDETRRDAARLLHLLYSVQY